MIDFATVERPGSPNTYLVCVPEICRAATADAMAPVYRAGAEAVRDALLAIEPRLRFAPSGAEIPGADIQGSFVAVTRVFRFRDDVDVLIRPLGPARSQLAVYSRSRLGYSDLGANRRRVEALLDALAARVGQPEGGRR